MPVQRMGSKISVFVLASMLLFSFFITIPKTAAVFENSVDNFLSVFENKSKGLNDYNDVFFLKDFLGISPLKNNISKEFVPGEVIVKFKEKTINNFVFDFSGKTLSLGVLPLDSLNENHGLISVEKISKISPSTFSDNVYKLDFPENVDVLSIVKSYERSHFVEYAEPNYIYRICVSPDDTYFDLQWALNQSNNCDIDAPEAWGITTGDSNVIIAVVDTGIDYNHPDLVDNIWTNATGKHGYDFVDNDDDPIDDNGHGTHCAGIIGAIGNNSAGIAGVSWNCTVMAIKSISSGGGGYETDLADGIIYAADNGADIISMSWGGYGDSQLIHDAIDYAYSKGAVLVSAAGNSNTNTKSYPAGYDNVIAVAATDENDEKAYFSNWGSWVDIAAPGVNILSTIPDDTYDWYSGTSMACPYVAGVAALLLSKNSSLSQEQVCTILKSSTDNLTSDYYIGMGRLNAYEAVLRWNGITTAVLNSSISTNELVGVVNITGTANGSLFTNYSVYYGSGLYPVNWTEIDFSSLMVNDSFLAEWNTTTMDDGMYTLRLVVNDSNGLHGEDRLQVEVNNVIMTLYVGGIGPNNYTTIQGAIDDSGDGDTIYVYNGTYYENLMINDNINLIGENYSNTIIDGNFSFEYMYGVWVDAERCNLSNFTIQNNIYGIVYTLSNGSFIQNNYMNNNWIGLYLISNVAEYGINNSDFSGGDLFNNRIENNTFDNNSFYGIVCEGYYTLIFSNTIEGEMGFFGILCTGANNSIQNNNIKNQLAGIYFLLNDASNLSNNIIYDNEFGIVLDDSDNNNISNTTIDNNSLGGILLGSSNNNIIKDNAIMDTIETGINITLDSNNNLIYHNNFVNNSQNAYDDGTNNWDNNYPSCGNYWDDYTGTDGDGDGIGDIPCDVSGGNGMDRYPLMNPTPAPIIYCVDDDFNSSSPGWQYDHFDVIQDGIDAVAENGTVYVYNGTYFENVILNKTINLIGEDKNTTIIDGSCNDDVIYVTADNVTISGFTIDNGSSVVNSGIFLSSNKNTVNDNIITNNDYGISIYSSGNNTIINNTIANSTYIGIYILSSSDNNSIENNTITNSNYGISIQLSNSSIISNNIITDTREVGIYLYSSSSCNVANNTLILNKEYGICLVSSINTNLFDNIITNNNWSAIIFFYSSNNTIYRNNISLNNWSSIFLIDSPDNNISNCSLHNNTGNGIHLVNSSDNYIANCNAYNSGGGFYLIGYSNDNHFTNCNVYNNSEGGIWLIDSLNNNITNCNIYNNYDGIFTDNSSNNYITKCNIYDNPQYGIYLYSFSNNNTIHHNNFINNTQNANDSCTNTWYNTILEEGNYWDDFDEPSEGAYDNNSDGIVDSPYDVIGGSNNDGYPLMHPFENYYILTITASSQVDEGTTFTITVKTVGGTTVQNASVNVFSGIYTTNSNGQVSVTAPSVSTNIIYTITATKTGYAESSSTITVKNIDAGGSGPGLGGLGGFGGEDTTSPAAPTNVRCTTPEIDNTPSFAWDASTDTSGIAGYYVKIDSGTNTWIGNVLTWTSTSAIADGTHTFYVKAEDNSTNKNNDTYGSCSFTINTTTVGNHPVANADGPYTGLTFEEITFDGSGSYDADGTITNYTWEFGDSATGYGIRPTHSYNKSGLFNITLTVEDDDSLIDSSKTTVTIALDSDGDGISDEVEVTLGSDPTNKSDVVTIDIDGTAYYLVDTNRDGQIDIFYNSNTKKTTTAGLEDGKYLIDINGDDKWESTYDPASKEVTPYVEKTSKTSKEFPWSLAIIGVVIAIVVIIALLYLTGYIRIEKEYIKERPSEKQQPKVQQLEEKPGEDQFKEQATEQQSNEQQPKEQQSVDDFKN
jgi:thermitase